MAADVTIPEGFEIEEQNIEIPEGFEVTNEVMPVPELTDSDGNTYNPNLQGKVSKRGWLHPVDFAKSVGKGVVHGLGSLGMGLGKQFANPIREKLGKRPLTDAEIQNEYGKWLGLPEQGGAYKTGEFAGELAPYFLLPETNVARLGKWGNRALTFGYQGGLGGELNSLAEKGFNPVENLKDTGIGAVGAIALGSAVSKGADKLARLQRTKDVMKRRNTPLAERLTEEQKENIYANRSLEKRIKELEENPELINEDNFYKGMENLSEEEQNLLISAVDDANDKMIVSDIKQKRVQNRQAKADEIAKINAERNEALKSRSFNNPGEKINKEFDKKVRQAQIKYNKIDADLKQQIKDLSPEKTDLNSLKADIGDVMFSKEEYTHQYELKRNKGQYYRKNYEDPMTYNIKESMAEFNGIAQDIKNNPDIINNPEIMQNIESRYNALRGRVPDELTAEFDEKLNQLMGKAREYNEFKANRNNPPEWEEITEAEYNALNNPVDDVVDGGIGGNEPPITDFFNDGIPDGTKTSKFIDTVNNSDLVSDKVRGKINAEYTPISNQETLSKAQAIIDNDMQGAINRVLTIEKPSEVEIAMAEDLARRLQESSNDADVELAIDILNKTAADLTKAGRTVQAARIWQGLTPQGSLMAYTRAVRQNTPPHVLEVLDNANAIINKVKTAETKEEAEQILKEGLSELNPSAKKKIIKQLKNAYEKGEVDVNTLKQAIEKHFKIKTVTKADEAELNELAENIRLAKNDREREINTALLKRKIEEVTPASLGRKVSTFQAGMQLLNPKTIIRNLVGNTGYATLEDVTQSAIATPIDKLVSKWTGQRSVMPTNLKTQAKGFLRGAKLSNEDIKYGIDTAPNSGKYDLWGGRTFRDGGLGELIEKGMNYTLRLPDRAAYTAVYDEAIENMLRASGVKNVTREMIDNAPQVMKDQANLEALQRTFQDDSKLAQWGQAFKRGLNQIPLTNINGEFGLGDLILKYAKTPSNILQRGIDYSPYSIYKGIRGLRDNTAAFNQRQAVMDLARGLMGSGIIGTGAGLKSAFSGIQGAKEDKDRLRANLLAQGNLPYSIPFGDKNYTFDWAVPTSIPLSAGVNTIQNGSGVVENILGGVNTLAEQPLLQGLKTFAGGGLKSIPEGLLDVGIGAVNSFYPSILRQAAQVTNPYVRETKGADKGLMGTLEATKNRFINNVPILNESLPIKYDVTGQPVSRAESIGERAFNAFLNPANVAKRQNNKALDYSMDVYNTIDTDDKGSALYPIVPESVKIDGEKVNLNKSQRSEYQKKLGRITQTIRENLLSDEEFMNLTKEEQTKEFSKYNDAVNGAIKYKMFGIEPKRHKKLVNDILEYYDQY